MLLLFPGIETLNPHAHVIKLMSYWVSHFKGFKHEPNGLKEKLHKNKNCMMLNFSGICQMLFSGSYQLTPK